MTSFSRLHLMRQKPQSMPQTSACRLGNGRGTKSLRHEFLTAVLNIQVFSDVTQIRLSVTDVLEQRSASIQDESFNGLLGLEDGSTTLRRRAGNYFPVD